MGKEMRDMVKKENSYCSWVGTFGTESAVRKRGGSRNLPYLNAKPRQIPLLDTYACTVTFCRFRVIKKNTKIGLTT